MADSVLELHKKAFIADLHCDTVGKILEGSNIQKDNKETQIDIPKLLKGNVNLQVFAAFINPKYSPNHCTRRALVLIDRIIRLTEENKELTLVRNPTEIRKLRKGKIGILLAIEGGDAIEGSLELLRNFQRLGVRIMTLSWNKSNRIGDAALDRTKPHNGLSEFGKTVVREMEKLHMLIDISHSSVKTFWDIYENTEGPFIASHTAASAIRKHRRNLNDEQIRAIGERGGITGIFFLPGYISRVKPVRIKHVLEHINHIRDLAGIDSIALGSDFDGMSERTKGLEHAGKLPALTRALLEEGYSEKDVKKILGGNFVRLFRSVSSPR
ncbi:MAG: membrane dipeptidase [Candidatus Cloacimonadota bacterium]|nr:MAG: membrane dipeptidase [Candidatus Cloacimonadota bacterium]